METTRKFYRSTHNKMIAGVASGIADYFKIDVVLVRLIFLLSLLLGGFGIIAYIVAWIGAPKSRDIVISIDDEEGISYREERGGGIGGWMKAFAAFICVVLVSSAVFDSWEGSTIVVFSVGVTIGLYYLWKNIGQGIVGERMGLYRSTENKRIWGVFGGLAERFGIDATILRVLGVVFVIVGVGVVIPLYCLYAILVPKGSLIGGDPERIVVV